jgi:hypothetical protein
MGETQAYAFGSELYNCPVINFFSFLCFQNNFELMVPEVGKIRGKEKAFAY